MGEICAWINPIPQLCQRTKNHCGINRLRTKLIAYQHERQQQQERIDTHHKIGKSVRIATYQRVYHDGQTRDSTDNQVARHQEIVHSGGTQHHADGHHH